MKNSPCDLAISRARSVTTSITSGVAGRVCTATATGLRSIQMPFWNPTASDSAVLAF